jgi:hypothetical protein
VKNKGKKFRLRQGKVKFESLNFGITESIYELWQEVTANTIRAVWKYLLITAQIIFLASNIEMTLSLNRAVG